MAAKDKQGFTIIPSYVNLFSKTNMVNLSALLKQKQSLERAFKDNMLREINDPQLNEALKSIEIAIRALSSIKFF